MQVIFRRTTDDDEDDGRKGDIQVVKRILLEYEDGAINQVNAAGWTPIHAACCNGRVPIINLLVDHGADIHMAASIVFSESKLNVTPMGLAVYCQPSMNHRDSPMSCLSLG